ncbi:DNA/RNA non-specific endonuclease [Variovorax terrae]|uniref:Endonuclease n=1 Tax=Variovorax terrae TaxID=2923278 RepID=A0A9X2APX3_9BURK|nr:DNA/RNA non-specific endonuclease [Variovorax terrae]MCJ0765350.1 DNA/RNA non-specific endonuclease [Variovorax terrae]
MIAHFSVRQVLATATLLAAFSLPSWADFSACRTFFPQGHIPQLPSTAPGLQRQLCFSQFAILHSGQSKTPLYVVERLNHRDYGEKIPRRNRFYEEARLPAAERARLIDYKQESATREESFDRGHMAPAGDMSTPEGMAQSFSLANVVPQASEFNQKAWNQIEQATRKYVKRASGDVYVFTGPVFDSPVRTLGPGRVWIPSHLFKLVYDPATGKSWTHWMANVDGVRVQRPISYEELVRRTGVAFLGNMAL